MKMTREMVFIDRSIIDIQMLLATLRSDVQAVVLSQAESAPAQIARAVARRSLDAVHIVAHGRPGEVSFGSGALGVETVNEHAAHLAAIGKALADGGSLLLWSCETGRGERGSVFVKALSLATGTGVAASSNRVGAAAHGGRWELDTLEGVVSGRAPLTMQGIASYAGVMTNSDPSVALTDVSGEVTELDTPSGDLSDSGTIAFDDVDLADAHSASAVSSSSGALGQLTVSVTTDTTGSGVGGVMTWNYSVAAADLEHLAAGATIVETFSFNLLDGQGGAVTRIVSMTLIGTNDLPVAVADSVSGTEGRPISGSLADNDSDADDGAILSYSLNEAVAGLTLYSDGSYCFDAADAVYRHLAQGTSSDVVASYTVTDENGASAGSALTVTLYGANEAPVAAADSASVAEGSPISGSLADNDSDADDGAILSYSLNEAVAGLTLNGDGSYSFDAADTVYRHLAQGTSSDVVASYTVTDENGASAGSTLTVTLYGANEAPVAAADSASVAEGSPISGSLADNDSDADDGAILSYSLNEAVAGLTLNGDGSYSFDAADAAYRHLAQGTSSDVVASYTVTDENGASAGSTFTITIYGTNDAPVQIDLNDDGNSDILWRNLGSGQNIAWNSGDATQGLAVAPVADLAWNIAGVGDFDGNGKSDILWRNGNHGQNIVWDGGDVAQTLAVDPVYDPAWKIAGIGDFNCDSIDDILWCNTSSGTNTIWRCGDSAQAQGVTQVADLTWKVAGIGDFDGDGASDILWRNSVSGQNIAWKAGDSAQGLPISAVGDLTWKVAGIGDFNGDGTDDILWRNSSSGINVIWRSGDSAQAQAVAPVADLSWKIVGTGDYNGDGMDDLLWRNINSGANTIWNAADAAQGQAVSAVTDLNWSIVAQTNTAAEAFRKVAADFDGDGKSDILWRNASSGVDAIWLCADSAQVQAVTQVSDTTWKIAGIGDFDGDGTSDVLWRNDSGGANTVWKGADSSQVQTVSHVSDTTWKIAGIGDFDGDGKSDMLWRNDSSGVNTIWRSADAGQGQAVAQVSDTTWKVAGIGDFNGDGKSDMLWRHDGSGVNTIWKNADSGQGQAVAQVSDTAWKVAGIGDFNGDGMSDILWRNDNTGQNVLWRSADAAQELAVTQVADTNWKVVGTGDYNGDGKDDILWRNSSSGADTIWNGADSAQVQAVTTVGDTNWEINVQTNTWIV